MKNRTWPLVFAVIATLFTEQCRCDETDRLLAVIAEAGPQGSGSVRARQAAVQLSAAGVELLPRLLEAMNTENVVAANWYRSVFQQVVTREFTQPSPRFPIGALKRTARNEKAVGRVRRLALKLLDRLDPGFRDELIPTLLDDPEFRGDAVAAALAAGDAAKASQRVDQARELYTAAFVNAREAAQITTAAGRLHSIGQKVTVVDQMGFVTQWYILGPFDAPGTSGFETTFPPETNLDLDASYAGKDGKTIRWQLYETTDSMGQLNLIQAIAPVKEAVAFAYTELLSPKDQTVELRCGADDNLTVWLNHKKAFARRQWLNGTRLDRFRATASLREGKNIVLVKICQGPQHINPAVPNNWSLQIRFCDKSGAGIALKSGLKASAKKN